MYVHMYVHPCVRMRGNECTPFSCLQLPTKEAKTKNTEKEEDRNERIQSVPSLALVAAAPPSRLHLHHRFHSPHADPFLPPSFHFLPCLSPFLLTFFPKLLPMAASPHPPSCFGFSIAKLLDKYHHSFFRSSGLQLRMVEVDQETTIACWCRPSISEPDKTKPALVLIHGFGTCAVWQWYCQVKHLQEHFRLFVPDLIFFGKSFTKSHHRSEVFQAQMFNKALEAMGISTYSVAGTSYGGFVAFRMASLFPERVQKVVIANSGVTMTPEDKKDLILRANVPDLPTLLLPEDPAALKRLMGLSIAKRQFIPSFILNDMVQYFYNENRKERNELLRAVLLGEEDSEPLPTLTQKTLIIWGDQDGIFPPPMAYILQKHFQDNVELVMVKGAAHCVQIENPNEFNSHLLRFLLD